jgi:GIL domain-containing protein
MRHGLFCPLSCVLSPQQLNRRTFVERAKGEVTAAIRAAVAADVPAGPAAACLGLDHVPARIGRLSSGMVYSLACDHQAVRLPLAAGALAASLRTGKSCALVTAGDPAMFLRKARLAGFDLTDHAHDGALSLFHLAAEADKHMFRAGPEGFLRELEVNLAAGGSFIVLDQADALFMLSDPRASAEAAQAYLRWIAAHDHTLLALFAPSAMAPREYLALRRIAENLAGFAVARSSHGGGTLDVRHWFAPHGASARETFALRLHGGALRAVGGPAAQDELPPVETVIYTSGAMRGAFPGLRDWQEAASHLEALQAASRSDAATLVLPFRQPADFAALCNTVAAVRAMARPELRVVVRECGRRLRAVQALALMRLGMSSVIPIDVPDIGAKRMIDLLKGTQFSRAYETDLQQVTDESAHVLAGIAGSVPLFCEAVESLLAAGDGFDFESCLVRVAAAGPEAGKLILRSRKAARDLLCVAKHDQAWLFLFGCPQGALAAVMERLVPNGASRWSAETHPERILLELGALRGA